MFKFIARWHRDGAGQDLLEYVMVGAFVALIVLAGASRFGISVNEWFLALAAVADESSADAGGSNPGGAGGGSGGPAGGRGRGSGSNCSGQGMASSNGKCGG